MTSIPRPEIAYEFLTAGPYDVHRIEAKAPWHALIALDLVDGSDISKALRLGIPLAQVANVIAALQEAKAEWDSLATQRNGEPLQ